MKKKIILAFITIGFIGFVLIMAKSVIISQLPTLNSLDEAYRQLPQAVTLTDRQGIYLESSGPVLRSLIQRENVSPDLKNALLASLDCAGYPAVKESACRQKLAVKAAPYMEHAYEGLEIGSLHYTIARNNMVKQLKKLPAEDLLEFYANAIPFSPTHYGVSQAARHYFNQEPTDLNGLPAILLGALSMNPALKPEINRDEILQNMRLIYSRLAEQLLADSSLAEMVDIPEFDNGAWQLATIATPIVNLALDQAKSKMAAAKQKLLSDGLTITTTLDLKFQQKAIAILEEAIAHKQIGMGSIVLLDAKSHEVIVMAEAKIGGGGTTGNLIRSSYPPGTIIKPFSYLAALQDNFTAASIISNAPYANQELIARMGGNEAVALAEVPLRLSLVYYLPNSWAALNEQLDAEAVGYLYKTLGLSAFSDYEQVKHKDLLGYKDVSFWEIINAYSAIAQNGSYSPASGFIKIAQNDTVLGTSDHPAKVVIDPIDSFILTRMLDNEFSYFSVKGGASGDGKNSYYLGYNGRYVLAVHVQPVNNNETRVTGATHAAPIWRKFIKQLPTDMIEVNQPETYGANCVGVDPLTAGRTLENHPRYSSCFRHGTEPTHDAPAKPSVIPPLPLD